MSWISLTPDKIKELEKMYMKYICFNCGKKYLTEKQKKRSLVTTCHLGKCDECGKSETITSVRHFNYCIKPLDL
jgi:predicted RNA-binding Zn-ribbon protein involved in translation (DUF1610 family)